jgi:polyhydroxyalkanoate synthesis regulator phasin
MGDDSTRKSTRQGLPDSVRQAVAKTVQATVGSAALTRERAQKTVDDTVRRAESGASVVSDRVRGAVEDAMPATQEDLRRLRTQLDQLEQRLVAVETDLASQRSKRGSTGNRGEGAR